MTHGRRTPIGRRGGRVGSIAFAAVLLLGACSERAPALPDGTSSAAPSVDRDTVFGLRLPAEETAGSAAPAPAVAAPLDTRLPVNRAYAVDTPRDPSVHRVDDATSIATPMPLMHEGLAANGMATTPAPDR
ncbi:MAG: hypothetical protein NTV19_12630 [Burkholderiales bacterium]|nr:hypothetical protein [Burkholderiales bacterium]